MDAQTAPRKRRRGCALLASATLLGLGWLGWWMASPDYIDVDVPMPLHATGVLQVWNEEIRARVRHTDDLASTGFDFGSDYVLRRQGIVDPSRSPLKSQQQILLHFDRWLTAHGWVAGSGSRFLDPALPEANLLPEGYPGVGYYVRKGDPYGDEGAVAVGVWPTNPRDLNWYTVVLVSTRPSFVRRLLSSID